MVIDARDLGPLSREQKNVGQDLGMLVDVVKGTLNGQSPADIPAFAKTDLQ